MHNLKANIINKEQQRLAREKALAASQSVMSGNPGLSSSLQGSASASSLFNLKTQQPRLMSNPMMGDSHKNLTIKKILHEMEKDLIQVEEENY